MKPKASPTLLHLGASYADEEKVLLRLASNGRAAFNRDANGWLPLHVAARAASVTIVKKLISQNPRAAETADKAGWLPLHFAACSSSSLPVVEALLAANPAGIRAETKASRPPLVTP